MPGESLDEFESRLGLPAKFFQTDDYQQRTAELQMLMARFPPWRFYTDRETGRIPYRVLGVADDETLATASSWAIEDGRVLANFCIETRPDELVHVPEWTADHLAQIEKMEEPHRHYIRKRTGYIKLCTLLQRFVDQTLS